MDERNEEGEEEGQRVMRIENRCKRSFAIHGAAESTSHSTHSHTHAIVLSRSVCTQPLCGLLNRAGRKKVKKGGRNTHTRKKKEPKHVCWWGGGGNKTEHIVRRLCKFNLPSVKPHVHSSGQGLCVCRAASSGLHSRSTTTSAGGGREVERRDEMPLCCA